jgi:uncharacterized protein YecT (DUF1311 family)
MLNQRKREESNRPHQLYKKKKNKQESIFGPVVTMMMLQKQKELKEEQKTWLKLQLEKTKRIKTQLLNSDAQLSVLWVTSILVKL